MSGFSSIVIQSSSVKFFFCTNHAASEATAYQGLLKQCNNLIKSLRTPTLFALFSGRIPEESHKYVKAKMTKMWKENLEISIRLKSILPLEVIF